MKVVELVKIVKKLIVTRLDNVGFVSDDIFPWCSVGNKKHRSEICPA